MIITLKGADFSGAGNNIGNLSQIGGTFTFTINPTPSDATVKINGTARKSITGAYGTAISWEVSKNGYNTRTGSLTMPLGGKTMSVSLTAVGSVTPPVTPEEPSRLPSEYQEVEYLKTSETQYFVLDEVSSNVIYEIKFRSDQLTSADGLIGCYSSSAEANRSQIRISCQSNSAGKTYHGIEFMYGAEGAVEKTNVATTQISVDYWTQPNVLKVDANKLYWNGELKVTRTAFTSNALATPFTLFAQNNNNAGTTSPGFGRQAAVECCYVKIQDTSKSINKELIPCYRKSDNAIGFYDIIGETFITPTAGDITEKGPNV
jgi:hypothetical protein